MGMSIFPVPCPTAVTTKALPSLTEASVLFLGTPGRELHCSLGHLLLPASFSSASIQNLLKCILSPLAPSSPELPWRAASSPPSFGSPHQAGEGQETSPAPKERDSEQGDPLGKASALPLGHSTYPTSPFHLPGSLWLRLPLPRSPPAATA